MHILAPFEALQVSGGYEYNIKDAILTSSAFSTLFGLTGAAAYASWFLSYTKKLSYSTAVAYNASYPILTLGIALSAGFGLGVLLGSVVGFGCYYSGLVTQSEEAYVDTIC